MPNFYGGLKKFFSLKEDSRKKDEAEKNKLEEGPSPEDVARELALAEEKIRNQELSPDASGELPDEKKPAGQKAVQEAGSDLAAAKKDSLHSLDQAAKLTFTAGLVDTSDIMRSQAHRAASEKMTADKKELSGFKGIVARIWKYNYAEQYLHEQERVKAKKRILAEGNVYSNEGLSATEKAEANKAFQDATLTRFTSEIKGLVEENLGEKREQLADTAAAKAIKSDLKKIINEYADGRIDEAGFEGAKRAVFEKIQQSGDQTTIKQSEMFVDNFLAIADQVKGIKDNIRQAADHQEKLAAFDFDLNLILGKAKEGIKTETHYNLAEKTVERLRRSKLGSLINETTLAASVGLAYSAGSFLSQRVLRSKAMAVGTLGLAVGVSGAYSGIKESQMQKRERQTLEARAATGAVDLQAEQQKLGQEITALKEAEKMTSDKKELRNISNRLKSLEGERKKMAEQESFLYQKKTARELSANLQQALYEVDPSGQANVKKFDSAAELDGVLDQLAQIEARLELSNEKKIDLISYSSLAKVESERLDLLQAKWQAKDRLQSLPADVSRDWEKRLKDLTNLHRQVLLKNDDGGIERKDQLFNKYKNKEVLRKVAQSAVSGLTIGLAAQEVFAAFSDKQEGLVENIFKGDKRILGGRDTALEALRGWLTGHHAVGEMHEAAIANGLVKLPGDCSWLHNPDGSFNLVRGSEVLAEHLKVNPDGSLTSEARDLLAAEHINVAASQYLIEPGQNTTTLTHLSPNDYIDKHSGDFKQVSRSLWYANDTPMYKGPDGKLHGADLNELKEQWGGDHGSGINTKTNCYEMTAFRMRPDGSFETVNGTKLNENAAELIKEGKMRFQFSLSDETQNQVIDLPVDPVTGKISVERGSELGKLLFGEKNSHGALQAVLKARFAEVVTSAGVGQNGVEKVHVFATAVGEGLKDATASEIINTPPQLGTSTILDVPREWDIPPVIPVGWRKPLGKIPGAGFEYSLYQPGPVDENRLKKMAERRSDTLNRDPRAKLDHYEEIEKYFAKMDKDYREKIKGLAAEAGAMSPENKVSICIPVAGHQEGGRIYESLKNYTYQKAEPEDFEICLMVNHPDHDQDGKEIKPDKTLAEIERFKKDYPQMNVKVMYKVIPYEEVNIGLVRKMLNDAVLYRQHERGKKAPDLIMVSNDADNLGIDPRYVQNFIKRFADNPKLDGVLGQLDWDPEAYTKYPLIHIGTRLFQYYSGLGRKNRGGIVSSGANFAFKSSIYAGIGGYLDDVQGGEDVAIGQAISLARGDTYETQRHGGSASRLFTSARRAIDVLNKFNLSPVEQWDKGFSAFDDEIRKMDLNSLAGEKIDYRDPKFLAKFKIGLEHIINQTLNVYERGEKLGKGHRTYREEIIGRLGIKYKLDDKGNVVITDMSKLVKGLETYQKEGILQRDARSGKLKPAERLKKMRAARQSVEAGGEKPAPEESALAKENDASLKKFYEEGKRIIDVSLTAPAIKEIKAGEKQSDLDGEYVRRDNEIISEGETGRVVAGYDKATQEPVVIKESPKSKKKKLDPEKYLLDRGFSDPALALPRKRLERGQEIIKVYQAAETDLEHYLESYHKLEPKAALEIIIRLSDAARQLHRLDVVHGDIAPSNVLLFPDGAKLGDLDDSYVHDFIKTGNSGNRFIMAPEMFAGEGQNKFDKTVDIYALSADLYYMLVGRWPHQIEEKGLTPEAKQEKYKELHETEEISYPDDIPPVLRPILARGLAVSPSGRYQSIDYLLKDLLSAYNSL